MERSFRVLDDAIGSPTQTFTQVRSIAFELSFWILNIPR